MLAFSEPEYALSCAYQALAFGEHVIVGEGIGKDMLDVVVGRIELPNFFVADVKRWWG